MIKPIESSGTYEITTEESAHSLGLRMKGQVNEPWQLVGNTMLVKGMQSTDIDTIVSIHNFEFLSLTTDDESYTKFKLIR